jgi:hypothetical protein
VDDDLAALPRAYALALRMEAEGADVAAIAAALALDVDVVPTLLEIGRRKRQSLLDDR